MSPIYVLTVLLCLLTVSNARKSIMTNLGAGEECPFAQEIRDLQTNVAGLWRDNRVRLTSLARPSFATSSLIFLTGDTVVDDRFPFRQNSNVFYLSGANMPDYWVSLFLTPPNASFPSPPPVTTLFVPAPSADYAVWNGRVYTKDQLRKIYDVDNVLYTNEISSYVASFPATTTVYSVSSSQVALPTALSKFTINRSSLGSILTNSRATKTPKEIILLTLVNKISSYAHLAAMQLVASRINVTSQINRPLPPTVDLFPFRTGSRSLPTGRASHLPVDSNVTFEVSKSVRDSLAPLQSRPPNFVVNANPLFEFEVESYFLYECGICGMKQQSYLPIVGAGPNGAVLHYIANDEEIIDGQMLLVDAGGEYWGYGSDITRTYPADGIFTAGQRLIYSIVLRAQADVVAVLKAGVSWTTLNTVARNSITSYLLEAGLIQGSLADLNANNVYNIFYPHSVGHSLGLDVHDSQTSTIFENQVITVEPGVYFNDYLLDTAKAGSRSKFINWNVVDQFRGTGGVRIEDDYVVTATGSTCITLAPRTIEEIEKAMSGGR